MDIPSTPSSSSSGTSPTALTSQGPMVRPPATPWLGTIPLPSHGDAGAPLNADRAVGVRQSIDPPVLAPPATPWLRTIPLPSQGDAGAPLNAEIGRAHV